MNTQRVKSTAIVLLTATSLIACSANSGPKTTGGTLMGAALGGLAGAQIGGGRGKLAAVAVGTLLGGLVGRGVGESLDRADRLYAQQTASHGLESAPSGTTTTWRNPDSGHSGTFTPTRTYEAQTGQYCREYQQTVTVGGRTENAYGTACRQPDGNWKIDNAG